MEEKYPLEQAEKFISFAMPNHVSINTKDMFFDAIKIINRLWYRLLLNIRMPIHMATGTSRPAYAKTFSNVLSGMV